MWSWVVCFEFSRSNEVYRGFGYADVDDVYGAAVVLVHVGFDVVECDSVVWCYCEICSKTSGCVDCYDGFVCLGVDFFDDGVEWFSECSMKSDA